MHYTLLVTIKKRKDDERITHEDDKKAFGQREKCVLSVFVMPMFSVFSDLFKL